jgi:hypothetical protein
VQGPAAGLPPGMRALPVPVDTGWGVVAGGWVDVWVLADDGPEGAVARSRPVLEIRADDLAPTALIGLDDAEVAAVTRGLTAGKVLLAPAPPPAAASR